MNIDYRTRENQKILNNNKNRFNHTIVIDGKWIPNPANLKFAYAQDIANMLTIKTISDYSPFDFTPYEWDILSDSSVVWILEFNFNDLDDNEAGDLFNSAVKRGVRYYKQCAEPLQVFDINGLSDKYIIVKDSGGKQSKRRMPLTYNT